PFVRVQTSTNARADTKLAFGFVEGPGRYETTLTRPDLFADYYLEQFRLLRKSHGVELEVGTSTQPIPIHFSFAEHDHVEGQLSAQRRMLMRDLFDLPDLTAMDDGIANGTWQPRSGDAQPLSLFTAPRVDYSLHRLRHYTGTAPEGFQNFVLFTNYQFYIDEFVRLGHAEMAKPDSEYTAFIEPGNVVTRRAGLPAQAADALGAPPPRLPQMPAYHLVRPGHGGITMVNIGVGPANAKTITDHIAVLRPHAWLMLGHCAGLRNSQQLGDYVLAHAYVREDHVLDEELPLWVPIPALAEIQVALEQAVAEVTQIGRDELKRIMRTGTVASTDNRNWELLPDNLPQRRFSQSRAVALDMESATIAANGFRFRVPYGTLLCVSDKPLHGEIKLPGMANHFYRERVDQHLRIGMRAIEILRDGGVQRLHSRKLRSFAEVAFQ
ncbi:MAG: AMP nucleosidase, partial [Giesbergeria sp.]